MPDLITHITFNHIICKLLKNKLSVSFVLLGGILPDFFAALYIILVDIIRVQNAGYINTVTVSGHSFFTGFLIALIIGLLFKPEKKYIVSFFLGYSLHLFLDLFQNNWGNGSLIFYPFYFKPFSFNLFTYGVEFRYSYSLILLFILVFMLFKEKEILLPDLRLKKILLSSGLIILLILLNFTFRGNVIKSNIFFVDLQYHPENYHNKVILINKIRLIKTDPPAVKFRGFNLVLKNVDKKLNKKFKYNIKGIFNYKDKTIDVKEFISFIPFIKDYISGAGLLIFILYIIFRVKIR